MFPPKISSGLRVHGLYELFRRAGVTAHDWAECEVTTGPECLAVRLGWARQKRIEFPIFPAKSACDRTVRLGWMFPPDDRVHRLVPDFILPHHPEPVPQGCLFDLVSDHVIRCKTDLPTIAIAVLARLEETASNERDPHGRFPANASVAFREGFLGRAIVDEYGLGLRQALEVLSPEWSPQPREFALKLSHDIDRIGIPFHFRTALKETLRSRRPQDTALSLLSAFALVDPPALRSVDRIIQISKEQNLSSAVYWMASTPSEYDSGYSISDRRVRQHFLHFLAEHVEMGYHASYFAFGNPELLRAESESLRSAIQTDAIGGRHHYLRWLPSCWGDWEKAGLKYDSSVGYADCIGFRAGTCIPYRPWNFAEDRPYDLLEIPLLVMECSLIAKQYMGLGRGEAVARVRELAERCRLTGGEFTLLCHNDMLFDPEVGEDFYLSLVKAIGTREKYDWAEDLRTQRQQCAHPAMAH
ncbi:hypothetical protein Acid345_1371 [Candidatus Koribacter versatilis Ellin345]|uniref:DUF7033 domain-containing protein n=1 Tax=Koribacter versatilis (strain Ellin345) TaxID=204669 RepID=Q1IRX7_KORVE|nr:polysaccharide deacetylase family protein [Candidatus Koribacter versatilis]ABF40373.1 hypothetical protein Acid345_1371 [Candidatus Koribacter versatilis Ellin345]